MRDFTPDSDYYPYASAMVGNKWVIMHMPDMKVATDVELPLMVHSRVCKELNVGGTGCTVHGAIFDCTWDAFAAHEITRTELDSVMASITPR